MIRDGSIADWADIWPFFRRVLAAGESLCLPNIMLGTDARTLWFGGQDTEVIVAVDPRNKPRVINPDSPIVGKVVGTASIRSARDGHGNHLAAASLVVDPDYRDQSIERELGIAALNRARKAKFAAVEIREIPATETDVLAVWESLGFQIVGTIPGAFQHPTRGSVGLHTLYRKV